VGACDPWELHACTLSIRTIIIIIMMMIIVIIIITCQGTLHPGTSQTTSSKAVLLRLHLSCCICSSARSNPEDCIWEPLGSPCRRSAKLQMPHLLRCMFRSARGWKTVCALINMTVLHPEASQIILHHC